MHLDFRRIHCLLREPMKNHFSQPHTKIKQTHSLLLTASQKSCGVFLVITRCSGTVGKEYACSESPNSLAMRFGPTSKKCCKVECVASLSNSKSS